MFPVIERHYWALELVDFRVGNDSMFEKSIRNDRSIKKLVVDSGTSYFTAPRHLHDRIVQHITEGDCNAVTNYPPLVYVLRDSSGKEHELKIPQDVYMLTDADGTCRAAFMALEINLSPAMILGEVFMRHFFTVFSRGNA